MAHIFTYGSLMYPQIWSRVVTGSYHHANGVAPGFTRQKLRGRSYPGLITETSGGASVQGVVYFNLLPKDLGYLDSFEGYEYQRVLADVMVNGESVKAWLYLWRGRYRQLLLPNDWCPGTFERVHMASFIKRYRGFLRGPNFITEQGAP